jgi:phosphocarrier protein
MTKEFLIIDEAGLHARPASLLVKEASKYTNEITITFQEKTFTLKSIMAVMSLAVSQNSTIQLNVEGDDAEQVMAALEQVLIDNNLV